MKSVLISIQPKWCELIASGKKTVEVRKTKPKIDVPFKCYIYETQGRTETPWIDEDGHVIFKGRGQVIGEFVCNCIVGIKCDNAGQAAYNRKQNTCVSDDEIMRYANHRKVYYWHISDLVIYDKPKDLSEFWTVKCTNKGSCGECETKPDCIRHITKPPQSWCYVEEVAMKETELKPCDAPLKVSERYIQIRDALDFQLRFAVFSKTDSIVISVHDARMLFEAADIVAEILKVKEADNEQNCRQN